MSDIAKNQTQSADRPQKPTPPRRPPVGGPGGPPIMHGGEKPQDFKGTGRKLLADLKPYRPAMVVVFIFAIGSTIFAIFGPRILGRATTRLFAGVMDKIAQVPGAAIDFAYIGRIILWLLLLYTLSSVFSYIQGFIMSGVAMRVSYNYRRRIAAKIRRLPLAYFDRTSHGDVLSRVTNDVDTLSNTLNQSLAQLVTSVTTLIGVAVMMFSISWQMSLAALLMLPLSSLFIKVIVVRSQKYFRQQQEILGDVNGHVEEMYGGHQVVKAFCLEKRSIARFSRLNRKLYDSAWKSQFLSGMMMPIMMFIGNLGYVVVVIIGGWLAMRRLVMVGDIQAFIQYIRQFTQPIAQVASIATVLQSTMAAAERVFNFLEEAEEPADTAVPGKPATVKGEVRFENVRFGYLPGKTIIHDFSLTVEPGQKIAIVGPTGAGKTTLVKLLMRFYDLESGRITIDGTDIRDMKRSELRGLFGMVLQDTWLFNGTIRENIRYGNLSASDEEVSNAARTAYLDHFIHTLPHGYDMEINEEASNLSQGQKQLLTIARAVLADPRMLILDEATSSVDTRTEMLIQKAMLELMANRTSFIIAHRLSTIRDADLILVMRDGDIVEQGSHGQLLAANGFYSELYNSQFETEASA